MSSNITLLLHTHSELSNTTEDIEAIMNKVSIVFLNVIVILGTTGNSVVIWVAGFLMKPNVTNVWLVNLAVADLIFCLTRVISLISSLFFNHWSFGVFLCKFNGFLQVRQHVLQCFSSGCHQCGSSALHLASNVHQRTTDIMCRSCGQCGSLDCGGDL